MGADSAGGCSTSRNGVRETVTGGGAAAVGRSFFAGFALGVAMGLTGASVTGLTGGAAASRLAGGVGMFTAAWGLTAAWETGSGSNGSTGGLALTAAASRVGAGFSETKRPAMRNRTAIIGTT